MPFLISIAMAVGMYIGYYMRDAMPGNKFFYSKKQKPVDEVLSLISGKYVDNVGMDQLYDTAIIAILGKLDPHSVFIPAEELKGVNEDLEGRFYGIGVEYNIFNDTIAIVHVLPEGPAFKAGLQAGDKIIKAGDSLAAGVKISNEKIRSLLRGERGSKIILEILNESGKKNITVTRDAIPLVSVDAAYMIDNSTGYIKLNRFSSKTYREFMLSLEKLKKAGLQKLVLDLRGNGGGVLEEAVEIADEFLPGDKLITYTEGSHFKRKEYRCKRQGQFEDGKLVVLIDEGTASASEVLCGALQDWDRASFAGRRSFGKGLVQEQYNLSDGSALRLTIARYYTPVGRSIQRPYTNGKKLYYDEVSNRFKDGETQVADSVKTDTTKMYKTAMGKKVYGGGGITPEYFVASDTGAALFSQLFEKGTISRYAIRYFLTNKTSLNTYKTPAEFARNFSVTPDTWKGFMAQAMQDSVNVNSLKPAVFSTLNNLLKASIARIKWRGEGYFQALNENDNGVKRALELLK